MIERCLVVPDAHAHPEFSNVRFSWLGKLVADERPDTIICLGDWADMPSLSAYDKGKRGFEGRRYKKDVAASRDALDKFHAPWAGKKYKPKLVFCVGNHEDRIDRATSNSAELDGTISIDELGFAEYGWDVHDYQDVVDVGGWSVSHHFASGVSGRPIGGANHASALVRQLHKSAVCGHSHLFAYAENTRPDGSKVAGLVAGCFSHPEQVEGWNRATQHMWHHGVTILDGMRDGYFESMRVVRMEQLAKRYGTRRAA